MPPVLHDNHLMRFVPLVPSEIDPGPWAAFQAVELAWTGRLHPDWPKAGLPVHAIHLAAAPWDETLGETAMDALRTRLEPDFLVLAAEDPERRMDASRFLSVLEGLLEITHGTGVKLALRPGPGSAPALVRRLREARGEAVGFCWDRGVAGDLECISDRLFCAVGGAGDDFMGLQALGFRWNVAVPSESPGEATPALEALGRAWPDVLFPESMGGQP